MCVCVCVCVRVSECAQERTEVKESHTALSHQLLLKQTHNYTYLCFYTLQTVQFFKSLAKLLITMYLFLLLTTQTNSSTEGMK